MGYLGYSQQNYNYPGYRQPGPGLAMFTGIVGLGVAGVLITETFMTMADFGDYPELPPGWTAMWIIHFVVAALALLGAVLVFIRQIAGAFLLMTSAVLVVTVLLLDPALAQGLFVSMLGALPEVGASGDYAAYFQAMFEFGNEQAVLRAVLAVLGLVLLITAVLPPSLNWLQARRRQPYGGYPQTW